MEYAPSIMCGHSKGKIGLMRAESRFEFENFDLFCHNGCNSLLIYETLRNYGINDGFVFENK